MKETLAHSGNKMQSAILNQVNNTMAMGKEKEEEWRKLIQTPRSGSEFSWVDEAELLEDTSGKNSKTTRKSREKRFVSDNFDISKIANIGFKLKFVIPNYKRKQLICEIDEEDISFEIAYWKHSMVCYILGAHPPFSVLNGYIQRQ